MDAPKTASVARPVSGHGPRVAGPRPIVTNLTAVFRVSTTLWLFG
jgi:hypothetical protein